MIEIAKLLPLRKGIKKIDVMKTVCISAKNKEMWSMVQVFNPRG